MHDREHQGTGAKGLPAHVGKNRNTKAAQDETGIKDTAQGLERESRGHLTLRGGIGSCPFTLELDSGPASASSSLSTTLPPLPLAAPTQLPEMPP